MLVQKIYIFKILHKLLFNSFPITTRLYKTKNNLTHAWRIFILLQTIISNPSLEDRISWILSSNTR